MGRFSPRVGFPRLRKTAEARARPREDPKRTWRKRSSIACELAALIPRPDANVRLSHGVLARWRSLVVRYGHPPPTKAWMGSSRSFISRMVTPPVRAYFGRALMANPWSTGITTTANGVPASSVTCGRGLPNALPPSDEFSWYGAKIIT
jgi:hypothetical protein